MRPTTRSRFKALRDKYRLTSRRVLDLVTLKQNIELQKVNEYQNYGSQISLRRRPS